MKNDLQASSFTGLVCGDALGALFEGMSRAHIHAMARDIETYMDTSPLLKGKMHRWTKPGLYTSLTQMMICTAMSHDGRRFSRENFHQILSGNPSVQDSDTGIFRHCGLPERDILSLTRDHRVFPAPGQRVTARVLPLVLPCAMTGRDPLADAINLVSCFTQDAATAAGAAIFTLFLEQAWSGDCRSTGELACESCRMLTDKCDSLSPRIFEMGINPADFMEYAGWYGEIISSVTDLDIDECERAICDRINPLLKTPVTRATVDDPRCQLPFALTILSRSRNDPPGIFFTAASMGGGSASLTAICGALAGARHGQEAIPAELVKNLVNRRRIQEIADLVARGRGDAIGSGIFFQEELRLTLKEKDELGALTRHMKKPAEVKSKSRAEKEMALSRHVVESWTKEDRARWKREKRSRRGENGDGEHE